MNNNDKEIIKIDPSKIKQVPVPEELANGDYLDEKGTKHNFFNDIDEADLELAKQDIGVNFRWDLTSLKRCKRIAKLKGIKYQHFIKQTLLKTIKEEEDKLLSNQ